MSERPIEQKPEVEAAMSSVEYAQMIEGLQWVVGLYLSEDDVAFMDDMEDFGELIGYVIGRLLEEGEDPDEVLTKYGVIEERSGDEV